MNVPAVVRPRHRPRWRGPLITVLSVLLVIGALLLAIGLGQRHLIYFPNRNDPGQVNSGDRDPYASDVTFTTDDGLTLHTWLFAPTAEKTGVAVLYLPGNGGNRLNRLDVAQEMAALGYTVLLLEYRGYGGNPG